MCARIVTGPQQIKCGLELAAILRRVAIYSPQGQLLGSFSAYDEALGVRCTAWSPSGQLLAVGSCDKVHNPAMPVPGHRCIPA